jgi:alpha-galactosidase
VKIRSIVNDYIENSIFSVLLQHFQKRISMTSAPRPAQNRLPAFLAAKKPLPNALWLESLDIRRVSQGWGVARAGKSCEQKPIILNGTDYPHGVGTHAVSEMIIDLKRQALEFIALAGVDDETKGAGLCRFQVWVDGKKKADTGPLRGNDTAKLVWVNVKGAKRMSLIVADAGEGIHMGHADWAGAQLVMRDGNRCKPDVLGLRAGKTDAAIAHTDLKTIGIHGPRIVGMTPGHEFIHRIPATGRAPLMFSAQGLPEGLVLDSKTGIIRGSVKKAGSYFVKLHVKGRKGSAQSDLRIIAGKGKLALTPPMGWNSWNVWAQALDGQKVRAAANCMIKSGLANFGYQYINIDDCWQGKRDKKGAIRPNTKFPEIRALADYVHAKGLKIGIYSSPGPLTCAGFEGSYKHEVKDARTYAEWAMDFLKHDWCSYDRIAKKKTLSEYQKPYKIMRSALDKAPRDIVYSLCQYGHAQVWKWGGKIGGNLWRTTGDIVDTWGSVSSIGFSQNGFEKYAGPGHWNDPDMLVVGWVGWGPNLHKTRLTKVEQITHLSLWSLLAAPLLIGCDLTRLDTFTFDLLTNCEVLEVNQDPLGRQAKRIWKESGKEVWARPLSDGTWAVGLFNREWERAKITINFKSLKKNGSQKVRDLWRKKNLGMYQNKFSAKVPPHGALMFKIGTPK